MVRPKKDPGERKTQRLTLYLTEAEAERLNLLSQTLNTEKTKILTQALDGYIKTLENPPPALRRASYEQIMKEGQERLSGFICSRGHAFWLEWVWPSPPESCPCCWRGEVWRSPPMLTPSMLLPALHDARRLGHRYFPIRHSLQVCLRVRPKYLTPTP